MLKEKEIFKYNFFMNKILLALVKVVFAVVIGAIVVCSKNIFKSSFSFKKSSYHKLDL